MKKLSRRQRAASAALTLVIVPLALVVTQSAQAKTFTVLYRQG